jgi:hypothetical protein
MTMLTNRRLLTVTLSLAALAIGSLAAVRARAQVVDPLPLPAPAPAGTYSYAVKFVCGLQRPTAEPGEPPVKPGNYATEVNIFDPNLVPAPIRKRVLVLVEHGKPVGREPEQVKARGFDAIQLDPGNATMDDCNRLWQLVYPNVPIPVPMPLTIGYLVLQTSQLLDVNAVYTAAAPGDPGAPNQGISIDVERVTPNRIASTTGALSPL